jgi:hypothetical protein
MAIGWAAQERAGQSPCGLYYWQLAGSFGGNRRIYFEELKFQGWYTPVRPTHLLFV